MAYVIRIELNFTLGGGTGGMACWVWVTRKWHPISLQLRPCEGHAQCPTLFFSFNLRLRGRLDNIKYKDPPEVEEELDHLQTLLKKMRQLDAAFTVIIRAVQFVPRNCEYCPSARRRAATTLSESSTSSVSRRVAQFISQTHFNPISEQRHHVILVVSTRR